MKKRNSIEEISKEFNLLREIFGNKRFSQKEIRKLLRENKIIPYGTNHLLQYVKHGVIERPVRGKYCFPSEPIYMGKIEASLKEVSKINQISWSKRNLNSSVKNSSIKILTEEQLVNEAIELLKKHGYRIQKPCITYEEI